MDIKELESPKYESSEQSKEQKTDDKTISLRIRKFANSAPFKVTGIDADQRVEDFEKSLSRKMQWSDRTTRLAIDGKLMNRSLRMGDVAEQLGDSGVLELIPDHKVGSEMGFILPTGLPTSFFSLIKNRINKTDIQIVETEIRDLPYKTLKNFEYGKDFRVEINSLSPQDLILPVLYIKLQNRFYPIQLILAGYPNYIKGIFLSSIPPCPTHNSGHHPHIFYTGDICWSLEANWEPNMTLYDDYIRFLINIMRKPREHLTCLV